MMNRCVAVGCNNTHNDGVSLFMFPKNAKLRKWWADQSEEPGRSGRQLSIQFSAANIFQKAALSKDQSNVNPLA